VCASALELTAHEHALDLLDQASGGLSLIHI